VNLRVNIPERDRRLAIVELMHFEMQVGESCRQSGNARISNRLTSPYLLAHADLKLVQVKITRLDAVTICSAAVIYYQLISVKYRPRHARNLAIAGGENRRSPRNQYVKTPVLAL
jgi:hypothetical protein